jgi:hypothetical protein
MNSVSADGNYCQRKSCAKPLDLKLSEASTERYKKQQCWLEEEEGLTAEALRALRSEILSF